MSVLSGMASFESVESRFSFNRWLTEKFVTETMRVRRFQQNSTTWEMPACMTTREVQQRVEEIQLGASCWRTGRPRVTVSSERAGGPADRESDSTWRWDVLRSDGW